MKPNLADDFMALVVRYNQLGRLLPAEDALDTDDVAAVAEARVLLQEMTQVKSEIDGFLADAKRRGSQI
jgi:hypothetical protein